MRQNSKACILVTVQVLHSHNPDTLTDRPLRLRPLNKKQAKLERIDLTQGHLHQRQLLERLGVLMHRVVLKEWHGQLGNYE